MTTNHFFFLTSLNLDFFAIGFPIFCTAQTIVIGRCKSCHLFCCSTPNTLSRILFGCYNLQDRCLGIQIGCYLLEVRHALGSQGEFAGVHNGLAIITMSGSSRYHHVGQRSLDPGMLDKGHEGIVSNLGYVHAQTQCRFAVVYASNIKAPRNHHDGRCQHKGRILHCHCFRGIHRDSCMQCNCYYY